MRARRWLVPGLLALMALAVLPMMARSDIAPPRAEELSCPRGAVGRVPPSDPDARDFRGRPLRPWPVCAPSTCESDADCEGGRVCSPEVIGLCVYDHPSSAGPVPAVRERGCEPDGTCLNVESRCERARRCVERAAPAADEPPSNQEEPPQGEPQQEEPAAPVQQSVTGCGCRVAPVSDAPLALLAVLGLALVIRAGRASRRARC